LLSYTGMRPTDIEQSLKQRFRGSAAAISSRTLTRLLTTLKEKGSITGKGRYRLPPHFQLDLSDQVDLELPDPTDADLPGWDA
jgi:DNA-binding HxlR family transcriptional regulator